MTPISCSLLPRFPSCYMRKGYRVCQGKLKSPCPCMYLNVTGEQMRNMFLQQQILSLCVVARDHPLMSCLSFFFFGKHDRNVDWRRKKEGGEKKYECSNVSPSHSYSVQMQQCRAEPAFLHCWRLIWPHTNTHTHTHTKAHLHALTSHKHTHTALTEALKLILEMLPAGDHWVSPLSSMLSLSFILFFFFQNFFLFLSLVRLPFCDPSEFIYLSHSPLSLGNRRRFLRWGETFQTFLSVCDAHTFLRSPLSSACFSFFLFFSFLCM